MKTTNDAPKTPSEMAAYRCRAACRIGRDALDEKIATPIGFSALDFAVYNLLNAVEDLSMQLGSTNKVS